MNCKKILFKVFGATFIVAMLTISMCMCKVFAMTSSDLSENSSDHKGFFDMSLCVGDSDINDEPSTPIDSDSEDFFLNTAESTPNPDAKRSENPQLIRKPRVETPVVKSRDQIFLSIPLRTGFFAMSMNLEGPLTPVDSEPSTPVEDFAMTVNPWPMLVGKRDFASLPNAIGSSYNLYYCEAKDRYSDIFAINQEQTGARRKQQNPNRYTTKSDIMLNASKVVRVCDEDPSKKFSIIATQAPLKETFGDFLDLLYTSNSIDAVVVLGQADTTAWTKKVGGIPAYFSDVFLGHEYKEDDTVSYGAYRFARPVLDRDFVGVGQKYNITISKDRKEKLVPVYHFSNWADRNVPGNIEDFLRFVEQFGENRKIVVHCSAGVGRTGVFSAYLQALRTEKNRIDPYEIVCGMRQYRIGMVQTPEQYNFLCYLCHRLKDGAKEAFVSKEDYTNFEDR